MLASAGDDVRIWDGEKFDEIVRQYDTKTQKVTALSWNQTNTQLASTSPGSCSINIAYADQDYEEVVYPVLDETVSLAWHRSSRYLALGCNDGNVKVYDLKNQKIKQTFTGHQAAVSKVTYNYNDTSLASGSVSGEIILHNTITEMSSKLMTTLKLQAIQGLEYSHYHHSMIASVSDDASLVLWDTNARRSVHQFTRSHKAPATDLSYSPSNDKLLISCGLDKRIVLYDVQSKSLVRTLQVDYPLMSICMNANGLQIASGSLQGQILIHDLRMGSQLQHTFTAHRSSVRCLAFHNKIKSKLASSRNSTTHKSEHMSSTDSPTTANENREPMREQKTPVITSDPLGDSPAHNSGTSIFSPVVDLSADTSDATTRTPSNALSYQSTHNHSNHITNTPLTARNDFYNTPRSSHPQTQVKATPPLQSQLSYNSTSGVTAQSGTQNNHAVDKASPVKPRPCTVKFDMANGDHRRAVNGVHRPSSVTPDSSPHPEREGAAVLTSLTEQMREELKLQIKSELLSEIKDMLQEAKDEITRSVTEHHFEMLKQFFLMQLHVEEQTSRHSVNFQLLKEIDELKAEIERLKKVY